jgi:hypothetical protein
MESSGVEETLESTDEEDTQQNNLVDMENDRRWVSFCARAFDSAFPPQQKHTHPTPL